VKAVDEETMKGYDLLFVRGLEFQLKVETPDQVKRQWDWIKTIKGITKGGKFCLDYHKDKCFIPTRFLESNGPMTLFCNDAKNQPYAVVQPLYISQSAREGTKLRISGDIGEHPNIVKLLAHGVSSKIDQYRQAYLSEVMAEEAPTKTLHEMLLRAFTGSGTKSQIYKKATIRKLIKDVAAGLKHLHSKNIGHGRLEPENIYMFKTSGAGAGEKYTAKLADFGWAYRFKSVDRDMLMKFEQHGVSMDQLSEGMHKAAEYEDTMSFMHMSITKIAGVLLAKAVKHTKTENPCTQDQYSKDPWVKEVCEIVTNLARIYHTARESSTWTSEELSKDVWVNATD